MFTREEAQALGITKLLPPDDPWHESGDVKPSRVLVVPETGMNKTEAAWAARLDDLEAAGKVLKWWFEPFVLPLAGRTTYRPDFIVLLAGGDVCAVEVKGFMRDDASVKLKVAAARWPGWRWLLVRRDGKGWCVVQVDDRGIGRTPLGDSWAEG